MLADGHVGAWDSQRGDWKYLWELFGFENYYNADSICHYCKAHKNVKRLLFTQEHFLHIADRGRTPNMERMLLFGLWEVSIIICVHDGSLGGAGAPIGVYELGITWLINLCCFGLEVLCT